MSLPAHTGRRKYLIIARVGDNSLHASWLEPKEFRNFDLCLCYYGDHPGRYGGGCDYDLKDEGSKWSAIKQIVKRLGDDLFQYEAIWCPDESLQTDAFNINRMFHIFTDQALWLAQPALSADSDCSRRETVQHPEYILRYTRSVEMTAPVFSPEALKACVSADDFVHAGEGPAFDWPELTPYPNGGTAVIDATPVKLARPASHREIMANTDAEIDVSMPPTEQEIEYTGERHESPVPAGVTRTPADPIGKGRRNERANRQARFGKRTGPNNGIRKKRKTVKPNKAVRLGKPPAKRKRKQSAAKKKRHAA